MTPRIEIKTITMTARDGMLLVLMLAVWQGRVIQIDTYRAKDMSQIETKSLAGVK